MIKKTFLFLLFFASGVIALAQTACPPFWSDIQHFKKEDSLHAPPSNAILFVGSSSFTMWKDVQDYFPGYPIINRGFGGSQLTDLIRYVNDEILPYRPKQVVIYCGENDLAADSSIKAEEVFLRFKTLFGMIRQNMPDASIHFISLKPSPSRQHLLVEFQKANAQIRTFLKKQKKAGFIDVYTAMMANDGSPRKDLFVEDNLHMNAEGYRIWQKLVLPYLLK